MPRGFTVKERERIKKNLLKEGRRLFIRYGLKKTSIKDLTEKAGIAQGSFYKFFSSKEELYFYILETEEEKLKASLFEEGFLSGKINRQDFRKFIKRSFEMIDENPFIKRIYLKGDYHQLAAKLPEEKVKKHIDNDTETLVPLIKKWQQAGCFKDKDLDAVSGLFRSLFLLTLHRKEIGEEHFEKTIDLLIDLMAEGLIREGEEDKKNDV